MKPRVDDHVVVQVPAAHTALTTALNRASSVLPDFIVARGTDKVSATFEITPDGSKWLADVINMQA